MNKHFYLGLILIFFSCGHDDQNDPDGDNDPTTSGIEFFVNEELYYVEDDNEFFKATNLLNINADEQAGSRLSLAFNALNDETIGDFSMVLYVQNWGWQMPPKNGVVEKKYDAYGTIPGLLTACRLINLENLCDGASFTLTKFSPPDPVTGVQEAAQYLYGKEDGTAHGAVTISKINTTDLTVTGTIDNVVFRRGMTDRPDSEFFPQTITVRGVFKNIPYRLP